MKHEHWGLAVDPDDGYLIATNVRDDPCSGCEWDRRVAALDNKDRTFDREEMLKAWEQMAEEHNRTVDALRSLQEQALRAENKALREWGDRAVGELAKWVDEAERKASRSESDVWRAPLGRVREAIRRRANTERRTADSARAVLDEYPQRGGER